MGGPGCSVGGGEDYAGSKSRVGTNGNVLTATIGYLCKEICTTPCLTRPSCSIGGSKNGATTTNRNVLRVAIGYAIHTLRCATGLRCPGGAVGGSENDAAATNSSIEGVAVGYIAETSCCAARLTGPGCSVGGSDNGAAIANCNVLRITISYSPQGIRRPTRLTRPRRRKTHTRPSRVDDGRLRNSRQHGRRSNAPLVSNHRGTEAQFGSNLVRSAASGTECCFELDCCRSCPRTVCRVHQQTGARGRNRRECPAVDGCLDGEQGVCRVRSAGQVRRAVEPGERDNVRLNGCTKGLSGKVGPGISVRHLVNSQGVGVDVCAVCQGAGQSAGAGGSSNRSSAVPGKFHGVTGVYRDRSLPKHSRGNAEEEVARGANRSDTVCPVCRAGSTK